ncbi:CmcI family methyltransferase [Aeromonas enteropelogenes]|uniref:CmcI family methyltransferase n=1 Tax=Aeromonas enteropelogenes TaxID=29489 RepID=UPI00398952BA
MQSKREVIGIDVREHNRYTIEAHPISSWIKIMEGSGIDFNTVKQVTLLAKKYKIIMILLDYNHTHEHQTF